MKWHAVRVTSLAMIMVAVILLTFAVYRTPAMQFLLDGFQLCS